MEKKENLQMLVIALVVSLLVATYFAVTTTKKYKELKSTQEKGLIKQTESKTE